MNREFFDFKRRMKIMNFTAPPDKKSIYGALASVGFIYSLIRIWSFFDYLCHRRRRRHHHHRRDRTYTFCAMFHHQIQCLQKSRVFWCRVDTRHVHTHTHMHTPRIQLIFSFVILGVRVIIHNSMLFINRSVSMFFFVRQQTWIRGSGLWLETFK